MQSSLIFFLAAFLLLAPAVAEETDFFQERNLPDSSAFLDQKMNQSLKQIATKSRSCKPETLHKLILKDLGGWGWSVIEDWVFEAPNHGKITKRKQSIYKGLPGGIWGCCSPNVNYQGTILSGDKLGHFLHSGYEMWVFAKNVQGAKLSDKRGLFSKTFDFFAFTTTQSFQNLYSKVYSFHQTGAPKLTDLEWAIELSLAQEDGWWGSLGTGVKSYGDIAANIEGYHFWSELTEGSDPYFRCESGRWKLVRGFSWAKYINAAWDEGINCNEYSNSKNQRALQTRNLCPVETAKCQEIRSRYRVNPAMYSPVCR